MTADRTRPVLAAHAVRLAYSGPRGQTVLDGLNLHIMGGRITALCGPNGCGKSTLLRAFAGLQRLSDGYVEVNGRPLSAYPRRALARELALLAQFNLIPNGLHVRELVAYGRYAHGNWSGGLSASDRIAIDDALHTTGLFHDADREVSALSGGERQRAWIAMAIAQQASILLLDEPTTYLDVRHQLDILRALRRLNRERGLTIVWVLHDLNQAAAYSDHIILMHQGSIVAEGAPTAMLEPDVLYRAFDVPMLKMRHPQSGAPMCVPSGEEASDALVQRA